MKGKLMLLGNRLAFIPVTKLRAQHIRVYKTEKIAMINCEPRLVWANTSWDDDVKIEKLFKEADVIYKTCDCIIRNSKYEGIDKNKESYLLLENGLV